MARLRPPNHLENAGFARKLFFPKLFMLQEQPQPEKIEKTMCFNEKICMGRG